MKRIIMRLMIPSALALVAAPMLAMAAPPTPTPAPPAVSSVDRSTHLNTLKTRGASEIDRRLARLQTAINRISTSSQITSAQKQAITTALASEVTALGTLKSKLAAESDLAPARLDIEQLITRYSAYGLLVPRAGLVATADRLSAAGTGLGTVITKLQAKAEVLKQAGRDTKDLQLLIDDAKLKLTDATPKYQPLTATLLAAKPADFVTDHKTLATYRDGLKVARDDFAAARTDIDKAIGLIEKLN